jgi:DNA invertase Pin-like site-specific DNA recombinase
VIHGEGPHPCCCVSADELCGQRRQRQGLRAPAACCCPSLCQAYRFEVADADWFYDAAVSGADPIEGREGFARLLDRIEGNGVSTVIVEGASRFARDLVVQ